MCSVAVRRNASTLALSLFAVLAGSIGASGDPITFAVRGSTGTAITTLTGAIFPDPPVIRLEDRTSVDEVFDADDLGPIDSSLTGSGTSSGYSGSGSALITDAVLGAYASVTSPGANDVSVDSGSGVGFIDYFTVQLPAGAFVPMSFTLNPSYTMTNTGGACGRLDASVQVGGAGEPFVGFLSYVDSTCSADALVTTAQYMVPTGVPFRVLYEMSASAIAGFGAEGTATVNALHSLNLVADPVGGYTYATMSGHSFLSTPAAVPEPGMVLLLGAGLATIGARYRRHPKP